MPDHNKRRIVLREFIEQLCLKCDFDEAYRQAKSVFIKEQREDLLMIIAQACHENGRQDLLEEISDLIPQWFPCKKEKKSSRYGMHALISRAFHSDTDRFYDNEAYSSFKKRDSLTLADSVSISSSLLQIEDSQRRNQIQRDIVERLCAKNRFSEALMFAQSDDDSIEYFVEQCSKSKDWKLCARAANVAEEPIKLKNTLSVLLKKKQEEESLETVREFVGALIPGALQDELSQLLRQLCSSKVPHICN